MSHFNVHQLPDARTAARWHNAMQELASRTRLGIPITVSTDPGMPSLRTRRVLRGRFLFRMARAIGMAALRDPETVLRFADTARQEYLAVGLRAALHPPTVDLATEPRWARQYSGFGQDPELTGQLAAAYLEGFQGHAVSDQSVACMTKHFPGGGPQKDGGEDPPLPLRTRAGLPRPENSRTTSCLPRRHRRRNQRHHAVLRNARGTRAKRGRPSRK